MAFGRGRLLRVAGPLTVALVAACTSVAGLTGGGGDPPEVPDGSSKDGGGDASNDGAIRADADAPSCKANVETDPENCGRCDHACLGGACVTGRCQPIVLATSQLRPLDILVDDGSVYYRTETDHKVMQLPVDGGLPKVIGCAEGEGLADDADFLYTHCFCNINVYAKDGGAFLGESPTGCGWRLFAHDNDALYFQSNGVNVSRFTPIGLGVPDGGTKSLGGYGSGKLYGLVHVNGLIFHTYTSNDETGRVGYVATQNGTLTALAPNEVNPRGLAADTTGTAWVALGKSDAGAGAGTIRTQGFAGDPARTIATGDFAPDGIAIDATYVYYATVGNPPEYGDARIYRARRDGAGIPEELALGEPAIEGIVVDDTSIYWINRTAYKDGNPISASGSVKRLAKP